jgi:hypothetical protein
MIFPQTSPFFPINPHFLDLDARECLLIDVPCDGSGSATHWEGKGPSDVVLDGPGAVATVDIVWLDPSCKDVVANGVAGFPPCCAYPEFSGCGVVVEFHAIPWS